MQPTPSWIPSPQVLLHHLSNSWAHQNLMLPTILLPVPNHVAIGRSKGVTWSVFLQLSAKEWAKSENLPERSNLTLCCQYHTHYNAFVAACAEADDFCGDKWAWFNFARIAHTYTSHGEQYTTNNHEDWKASHWGMIKNSCTKNYKEGHQGSKCVQVWGTHVEI